MTPEELKECVEAAKRMFSGNVVTTTNFVNGKPALRPVYKDGRKLGRICHDVNMRPGTSKNMDIVPFLRDSVWL